jgi:hypothetical protein
VAQPNVELVNVYSLELTMKLTVSDAPSLPEIRTMEWESVGAAIRNFTGRFHVKDFVRKRAVNHGLE